MAADAPPTTLPTDQPPAPPPAASKRTAKDKDADQASPVSDGRGGYVLPRALKHVDVSGLTPRNEDTGCPECGSPLFARVDVVRMAQGYTTQGGQKRGVLLVCVGCGEALNGHEVKDW